MNRNFIKFLLGTKLQTFVSSLYRFGFLLIFYQFNRSVMLSGILLACTIVVSRSTLILVVPYLKKHNPIQISIFMNLGIGIVAILALALYPLWQEQILIFFILSIIFSALEEVDNSFQYAVMPRIVAEEFLFKANSLNAILANINLIAAPIGSYIFYLMSDLRGFLLAYGVICFLSAGLLKTIDFSFSKSVDEDIEPNHKRKRLFFKEWKKSINIIFDHPDILFCIGIGVAINLIFSGINGAVMLKMGEISTQPGLGQTIIKISLSAGSLVGVLGVFKLKVKENYQKYLKFSILSLIVTLSIMAFVSQGVWVYGMFFLLGVFIMFIMNATGTFLQLASPKEELSAIYTFRSTLYAMVVPLSHLVAGAMMEYLSKAYYFIFSAMLLLVFYLRQRWKIN